MKMIMLTSMLLNLLFMNTKKPMNIIIIILIQASLMASAMSTQSQSPWFSYLLLIIFIGAMMVTFIYVASIMPNENYSLNKATLTITITSILMLLINNDAHMSGSETLLTEKKLLMENHTLTLTKMFNKPMYLIYITMMVYLFITLIAVSKICNTKMGPLRKKTN